MSLGVEKYVDKEMSEYIIETFAKFSDKLNEIVGYTDYLLNVYKNASESIEAHNQMSRYGENA